MFANNRENEIQRSAGIILCCLATASDKNITISTKYDEYPELMPIFDPDKGVNIDLYAHSLSQRRISIKK